MKKPDELVVEIERSIFSKALAISLLAHAVLIAITSISLFRDWTVYGVHSPSYINGVKAAAAKEAEETRRKVAAEAKAAAEAAKAEQMKAAAESNKTAKAQSPAPDGKAVQPPEIKPLPPKKEFEYGEDLSLD